MIRRNFDDQATTSRPHTPCVCCGCTLHSYWQPALVPGHAGHWLMECHDTACEMWMQTFSDASYPPDDVPRYIEFGRKRLAGQFAASIAS